jgi:hypothetical protein
MDPPGTSTEDFNKAKKTAGDIADAMKKIPEVGTVSINYTGKRGFHIFGKLKGKKDVNDVRKFVQEWLKETFGNDDRYTLGESPTKGKIALGVAPLKINGGHVALWSMRVSGLCCVEVPRDKLSSFTRESATPQKIHQKLTGKPLKQIKKLASNKLKGKKMSSEKKVVESFLQREGFKPPSMITKEVPSHKPGGSVSPKGQQPFVTDRREIVKILTKDGEEIKGKAEELLSEALLPKK